MREVESSFVENENYDSNLATQIPSRISEPSRTQQLEFTIPSTLPPLLAPSLSLAMMTSFQPQVSVNFFYFLWLNQKLKQQNSTSCLMVTHLTLVQLCSTNHILMLIDHMLLHLPKMRQLHN